MALHYMNPESSKKNNKQVNYHHLKLIPFNYCKVYMQIHN